MLYDLVESVSDTCANAYEAFTDILPSDTPTLTLVSLLTAFTLVIGSLVIWG